MKKLELADNKIESIENISFLTKLELLNVDGNNISKISGLESLTSLESLNLTKNNLRVIDGGLESQENSLKEIWLYDTQISEWSSIKYLGKTLKACSILHIIGLDPREKRNPICHEADFENKVRNEFEMLERLT